MRKFLSLIYTLAFASCIVASSRAYAEPILINWTAGPALPTDPNGTDIDSFSIHMESTFPGILSGTGSYPVHFGSDSTTPCLVNGLNTDCSVTMIEFGGFPFAGIVVNGHTFEGQSLIGPPTFLDDSGLSVSFTVKAPFSGTAFEIGDGHWADPAYLRAGILTVSAVPEPAPFVYLLTGGSAALGVFRRRWMSTHA